MNHDWTLITKALLQNAFQETNKVSPGLAPPLLRSVVELLKSTHSSLFQEVPKSLSLDIEDLKLPNVDTPIPGLIKHHLRSSGAPHSIEHFPAKGLLIDDAIHASSFGHMNYIYRAKGMRSYLFADNTVGICNVECSIDDHGFQLIHEKFDTISIDLEMKNDDLKELFGYLHSRKAKTQTEYLIEALCGFNEPFKPAYFIEHILVPPDVQRLSEFSQQMRSRLWECVISDIKECAAKKSALKEGAKHSLDLLSRLDIPAPAGALMDLLIYLVGNVNPSEDLSTIFALLKDLRDRVIPDSEKRIAEQIDSMRPEIVELKPNIAGIGVNVSELVRRATEWMNKT